MSLSCIKYGSKFALNIDLFSFIETKKIYFFILLCKILVFNIIPLILKKKKHHPIDTSKFDTLLFTY